MSAMRYEFGGHEETAEAASAGATPKTGKCLIGIIRFRRYKISSTPAT